MASSDDDEDLKRAIALSLQDEVSTSQHSNAAGQSLRDAINLDSDTEDDEALSESLEPVQKDASEGIKTGLHTCTSHDTSIGNGVESEHSISTSGLGFLGLNRKKMEQERLARKRRVSISPPPPRKATKFLNNGPAESPKLAPHSALDTTTTVTTYTKTTSTGNNAARLQFPQGTVKKTWAFGHPKTGDDIKLEEVLQKNDLSLAVLSSFQWDVEWLLAKINTRSESSFPITCFLRHCHARLTAKQLPRSLSFCKPRTSRLNSNTGARQPLCLTCACAFRQWRDKSIACIPSSCCFLTLLIFASSFRQPI